MNLDEALLIVRAAGYNVSKPKIIRKNVKSNLNALGLPLSPLYDPKYKIKTPKTSIRRLLVPMPSYTRWVNT